MKSIKLSPTKTISPAMAAMGKYAVRGATSSNIKANERAANMADIGVFAPAS